MSEVNIKTKNPIIKMIGFFWSGWQDSNLRPPRPKRGAMTGLRYTPKFPFRTANIVTLFTSYLIKNYYYLNKFLACGLLLNTAINKCILSELQAVQPAAKQHL